MNVIASLLAEYWTYFCFPLIFVAIVVWVYRPTGKAAYRADGDIPFEEEDNEAEARRWSR